MGHSLAHAATSESLLSQATQGMITGNPATSVYLSMASTYALLSESYARLASAQIVNNASVNQIMATVSPGHPERSS